MGATTPTNATVMVVTADQTTSLLAISKAPSQATREVRTAWEAGDAVLVLDPALPSALRARVIDRMRPTELSDDQGRRRLDHGTPVSADVAAVVLTSGTTGEPRGVELTRVGLASMAGAFSAAIHATSDDRWLLCLPLHHVGGLAVLARSVVTGQGITVHDRFDVDAVSASPQRDGTTLVSLVPTALQRILDVGAPLSGFRMVILGGAPVNAELRARAHGAGAHVVSTYGMSETWGGCVIDGRAINGVELRIAENGEVLVRGPMVAHEYRNPRTDPNLQTSTRPMLLSDQDLVSIPERAPVRDGDGWLHTGDNGEIDADGTLRIIDRIDDLIISGGVNVSPTDVERALGAHHSVADVAVVGAPDQDWGERVVAYIVPMNSNLPPTLEALRDFGRANLSAAQLPREIRIIEEIPRSAGGKILRRVLRER